jgi:hypothetical protein
MHISGSNNLIERCVFRESYDSGLQLDNGASNNQIINCDSYYNSDPGQGNADGFAVKLNVGSGNYFFGCRSWQNSDDGWDGYLRGANNVTTTLENCWVFMNGYLKDGTPSSGNGNGFKMGGSDQKNLEHNMILKNCLSVDNRVKGFDQNSNKGSMTLYNCTGYRNGTNYSVPLQLDSGKTLEVKNCLALGIPGTLGSFAIQATNGWMSPFNVTGADFLSIDTAGIRGDRQADGSLPAINFMHLVQGSPLIDAGTDVGLPCCGSAPDLGCFETPATTSVGPERERPVSFSLEQNYPNPFNSSTKIQFHLERSGFTTLTVYNVLGQKIATLLSERLPAGSYNINFDAATLATGICLYRLESGGTSEVKKMNFLK